MYEIELRARMVRVEEDLKRQRELIQGISTQMDQHFAQMERRFDEVGKRFEHVDKRFEQVDKRVDEQARRMDRFMV